MSHLDVKLVKVCCGDTENVTGGDRFYIVGALVVGAGDKLVTKGVLTQPTSINDDQAVYFRPSEAVVLDGDVSSDSGLHLALSAFDQDSGGLFDPAPAQLEKAEPGRSRKAAGGTPPGITPSPTSFPIRHNCAS